MNRQIKILGAVIMVCYLAAFVKLNQIQVLDASKYNDRPENTRAQLRDFNRPRGDIVTADGQIAATSEERRADLLYQRVYPAGDLYAHITGFYSFRLGSTGVERVYNAELTGRTASLEFDDISGLFSESSSEGDVVLTVRSDVQQVAKDSLLALGSHADGTPVEGSVVALDPRTGAVLAMYSNPSYDPNAISTNDGDQAEAVKTLLDAAPSKPLLSRAYQDRFFPGSTFKVVTATAGLTSGLVTEATPDYPVVTSYTPPLTTRPISNFDGSACGGTLFAILQKSCNSSFAQMAAEQLGADPMIAAAEAVGFNDAPPIDLTRPARSVYPTDFGAVVSRPEGAAPVYEDTPALAQTAIGQNDVAATPLQMALVAAGVANGGRVMTPHVMNEIRARDGDVVDSYEPNPWRDSMSPEHAEILRNAMISVVEQGTASSLRIPGVQVGAKTGTAQLGTDPPKSHAWIIAFAGPPGQEATVAVAVMVQDVDGEATGATGNRVAGPIAQ
ncbi:MAG: peptidoglycan D,D-transpeptidase FtsI family protein, partial [Microthrixaceae bacterium]